MYETGPRYHAAKRKRTRIDGQSLGYGTAFSAVALSQRPGSDGRRTGLKPGDIAELAEQALRLRHLVTAGQRHHVKVVQNE